MSADAVRKAGSVETIARICECLGAEKLPGRLRDAPTAADLRQSMAYIRGELDAIDRDLATALDDHAAKLRGST